MPTPISRQPNSVLTARGHRIRFPRRPLVMGILNINDDSFSGDGSLDQEDAIATALNMLAKGADIIDVGAESARTNRGPIPPADEVGRLLPFLKAWPEVVERASEARDPDGLWPPLLSINTWRSEVVAEILPHGGDLLNDIGALPDDTNARICADHGAALLIMHSVGAPKVPHRGQRYEDVMGEMGSFFREKIDLAIGAGLGEEALVLDPGIDFAKSGADNLRIYAGLPELVDLGRPVLLPVSRKDIVGEVLGIEDPADRDAGTMGSVVSGMLRGASLFRVHNVPACHDVVRTTWAAMGVG